MNRWELCGKLATRLVTFAVGIAVCEITTLWWADMLGIGAAYIGATMWTRETLIWK